MHAVALLGGHAGRWVAEALAAEGVALDHVAGPGETRMALSVAAEGPLTEFYEPAPEIDDEHWAALEATVERVAHNARWVAICGSLPPGAPDGRLPPARARRPPGRRPRGARRARRRPLAGLRRRPRLREGQRERGGRARDGRRPALRAAAGGGDRTAAITHGTDGLELATTYGQVLRAAPPVHGRFPVGSGDAALGGFLTALDVGGDWAAALALATGAAAANAEVPGAGRLDGARALS